jgi:hypothetical protein
VDMVIRMCGINCTLEELLFQLSLGDFNLDSLVNLLGMASLVVRVILDRS